jgi:hypothetical protein
MKSAPHLFHDVGAAGLLCFDTLFQIGPCLMPPDGMGHAAEFAQVSA